MLRGSTIVAGVGLLACLAAAPRATAQTFGSPSVINSNASADTAIDVTPQIATDRAGHWVVAWSGAANSVAVSRSSDNGATWTPLEAINDASTRGGAVQLATDGAGIWVAVWEAQDALDGSDVDLFTSRSLDAGATWSVPAPLNTDAATDSGDDLEPELATDGAGTWIATWASNDTLGGTIGSDYDILYARSVDGGVTWSPPSPLNSNAATDTGADNEPDIETDGAGTWLTIWTSRDSLGGTIGADPDILVSRSNDAGVTWTPPSPLNTNAASDSGDDFFPRVAADGHGDWIAVWTSTDSLGGTIGNDEDTLTATSTDGGLNWSAPHALNSTATRDTANDAEPQVTTDGLGTWIAIWYGATPGNFGGGDDDILIARSTDLGSTWSLPLPLNTNAAHDRGSESDPQLATDGAGTWLAVWDTPDVSGKAIGDFDIVVARGRDIECTTLPMTGCTSSLGEPGNSLLLRNAVDDGNDEVLWKWNGADAGGPAAFGDPSAGDVLSGTSYRFCVYDGNAAALLASVAPAGGVCRTKACWKAASSGLRYGDPELTPGGIDKINLKANAGRDKLALKGSGPYLAMPALDALALPLVAQLQAGNGSCWESTYSAPSTNSGDAFQASGD